MFDAVRRDFSFTARSLRRAPTFSVTVVLILGLAIGMSSAMLTVFRSVLLERLPVKQQDRIVELSGLAGGAASEVPISPAQVRRFREQSRTLEAVAGLAHWRVIAEALVDGDRRLSLREAVVTDEFFGVLGADPLLGRLFRKGDAVSWGANATGAGVPIVLSHSAWQHAVRRRLIGDRTAPPLAQDELEHDRDWRCAAGSGLSARRRVLGRVRVRKP